MSNPTDNLVNNDPDTNTSAAGTTRRRRGTIVGVTAGLLGGGLVGLAMTVPSFTTAASEDTTPAVVEQTDESGPALPDRGARLRGSLQALVDDGTLTSEQADAVTEHLTAQLPDRGFHRGHRRPGMDGDVVAGLLGIETDELRSALRDGQSIAELAEANAVDPQVVIDALVDQAQSHLDLAVENGRLTDEEAAEKASVLEERITSRVNGERPGRR